MLRLEAAMEALAPKIESEEEKPPLPPPFEDAPSDDPGGQLNDSQKEEPLENVLVAQDSMREVKSNEVNTWRSGASSAVSSTIIHQSTLVTSTLCHAHGRIFNSCGDLLKTMVWNIMGWW
jgi:hypothetical protein